MKAVTIAMSNILISKKKKNGDACFRHWPANREQIRITSKGRMIKKNKRSKNYEEDWFNCFCLCSQEKKKKEIGIFDQFINISERLNFASEHFE